MSSGISAHLASLEAIFDPFQPGTTPAPNTNITGAGAELSTLFANILYGTAAPATGITTMVSGVQVDLNTLYAAKGTASYSLPIQGETFNQATVIAHASSGSAALTFGVFSGNWSVSGSGAGTLHPAAGTQASGPVPSGATTVKYAAVLQSATGSPASSVTNGAASATAISSNPTIVVNQNGTGTGAGSTATYGMTVIFYNAGGTAISTTNFTFAVTYDGSA